MTIALRQRKETTLKLLASCAKAEQPSQDLQNQAEGEGRGRPTRTVTAGLNGAFNLEDQPIGEEFRGVWNVWTSTGKHSEVDSSRES